MIDEKKLIESLLNKKERMVASSDGRHEVSIEAVIDYIAVFPKVGEWIPVSERLPETDGRFEVTIKGCKGKRHVEMCNFYKNAKTTPWGLGKWEHGNVIAWRQRSEPYRKDVE